jgi:hypothetical protein
VLWTNGVPQVVALPGGNTVLWAVNRHGVVVGTTTDAGGLTRMFRWVAGTFTYLTVPMSGSWYYNGVFQASDGSIVAEAGLPSKHGGLDTYVAVRWAPEATVATQIPIDVPGIVVGIMDDGHIVWAPDRSPIMIYDPDGTHGTEIAASAGGASSAPYNAGDFFGGYVPDPSGQRLSGRPMIWNARTNAIRYLETPLSPLGLPGGIAEIDAQGDALVSAKYVLFADGIFEALPTFTPDQTSDPSRIVSRSQIIGSIVTSSNVFIPVIWHC